MSIETIFNAIRTDFNTNITTGLSLITHWDNAESENPNNETHCRMVLRILNSKQASIGAGDGNNLQRTLGTMSVQVFTPINRGTQDETEILDALITRYETRRITVGSEVVKIDGFDVNHVGRSGDYWQTNLNFTLTFDRIG